MTTTLDTFGRPHTPPHDPREWPREPARPPAQAAADPWADFAAAMRSDQAGRDVGALRAALADITRQHRRTVADNANLRETLRALVEALDLVEPIHKLGRPYLAALDALGWLSDADRR